MRLRHYLRGLGIGIVVTAIVIHLSQYGNAAKAMDDDDIIKRAKELGMIENTVLTPENTAEEASDKVGADTVNTDAAQPNEADTANDSNAENDSNVSETQSLPKLTPEVDSDSKVSDNLNLSSANDNLKDNTNDNLISIEVKNGDGSMNVANRLEAAGLVKSAKDFDTFLCDNDYDNILTIGIHMIPVGSSEEEIASILMGKTRN